MNKFTLIGSVNNKTKLSHLEGRKLEKSFHAQKYRVWGNLWTGGGVCTFFFENLYETVVPVYTLRFFFKLKEISTNDHYFH